MSSRSRFYLNAIFFIFFIFFNCCFFQLPWKDISVVGDEPFSVMAQGVGNGPVQPSFPLAEDTGVGNKPLQSTVSQAEGSLALEMNRFNPVLIRKKVLVELMDNPLFSLTLPFPRKKALIDKTDQLPSAQPSGRVGRHQPLVTPRQAELLLS